MADSFVLYADLLGIRHQTRTEIEAGRGQALLDRLTGVLRKSYGKIREWQRPSSIAPLFSIKVFTDNLVVGYPLKPRREEQGWRELFDIFCVFKELQVEMAMEGFFLRGGIARGDHYMDDDIVFGGALLEVVHLDRSGTPPRLVLADSALRTVQDLPPLSSNTAQRSLQNDLLRSNGTVFLDYLSEAFAEYGNAGIFMDLITRHKSAVMRGLESFRDDPKIRRKYKWLARYHNFVCRDFAERHPIPQWETDEETALDSQEAQELLTHIIPDTKEIRGEFTRFSLA